MRQSPSMRNTRQADHPVDAQFTERWSPRAFTGEAMTEAEVMALLEAARWAPSSNNGQPWRFAIALRGDPLWDALLDSMNPTNRSWAAHAGAIGAVAAMPATLVFFEAPHRLPESLVDLADLLGARPAAVAR